MFGKTPGLNPLASRRQLLVAESELNRIQLGQEWAAMTRGVHTLSDRLKTYRSLASSGALLVAGLAAFRRGQSGGPGAKLSRWQSILKGASLVSTLWLALRSHRRDQENKAPDARA